MQLITLNETRPIVFFMAATAGGEFTGGSPIVTISQDGASFVSPVGTVTEIGNGFYKLVPAGTDTSTLGPLRLRATASGAANAYAECQVITQDLYGTLSANLAPADHSVPANNDGTGINPVALIWAIYDILSNAAQNGTTLTAYGPDGVTPAMTYTLDNASAPTSRKRAT